MIQSILARIVGGELPELRPFPTGEWIACDSSTTFSPWVQHKRLSRFEVNIAQEILGSQILERLNQAFGRINAVTPTSTEAIKNLSKTLARIDSSTLS